MIERIVSTCINLIEIKQFSPQTRKQQEDLRYWRSNQKEFDKICMSCFNSNVYETFMEYVFHMLMNFVLMWRFGEVEMHQNYLKNKEKLLMLKTLDNPYEYMA